MTGCVRRDAARLRKGPDRPCSCPTGAERGLAPPRPSHEVRRVEIREPSRGLAVEAGGMEPAGITRPSAPASASARRFSAGNARTRSRRAAPAATVPAAASRVASSTPPMSLPTTIVLSVEEMNAPPAPSGSEINRSTPRQRAHPLLKPTDDHRRDHAETRERPSSDSNRRSSGSGLACGHGSRPSRRLTSA
jgi:hypothetical protein